MVLGLERRQLLAAHIGAAARHHHRGIPAQQRQRAAKGMQAAKFLFQLLVGRQSHGNRLAARRITHSSASLGPSIPRRTLRAPH